MKWSRSNKEDSFNCITHPHSTSRLELFSLSAGMDIVKNNAPADDVLLNCPPRHNLFFAPRSRSYKHSHPRIRISHRRAECVTLRFFRLQTDLAPPKRQSMSLYRLQSCKTSLRSGESSDVSSTPKDKSARRYWLVPSSIYGSPKQGRLWNATLWLFGGANLFYLM